MDFSPLSGARITELVLDATGVRSLGVLATGALGDWLGPREAAMVSMPALLAGSLLALHPGHVQVQRNQVGFFGFG